jgi:D-serine deaminase-like pyridoxal phosphate-dependent protein
MDTAYHRLALPFAPALWLLATVISVSQSWAVADCGLKALGMDHGNPEIPGARVLFCSDEHLTFVPGRGEAEAGARGAESDALPPIGWTSPASARVGDRIRIVPAHVDPTVAYHERFYVVDGEDVIDEWPIDLRGW